MKFVCSVAFSDPSHLVEIARHADEAGFDMLSLSDHVVFPEKLASSYPYSPDGKPMWEPSTSWPDCFVAVGAMAAVTKRIRFVTNVFILPARDPFVVAKAAGTAAVLSGNRLVLGVGSGWMKDEFDLMGQDFSTRGARTNEMIDVLRTLWRGGMVEHHGKHYDFDRLEMSPAPSATVPIYAGGVSEPALRRAARKCDGWLSPPCTFDELRAVIARIEEMRRSFGREDTPFDYVVACRDRAGVDGYRALEDIGVTSVATAPWVKYGGYTHPLETKKRALEEFANDVIARMR